MPGVRCPEKDPEVCSQGESTDSRIFHLTYVFSI